MAIFERFWHYWGFDGDSGVLGVPVSYWITRGDKLVVGRVNEEVKGGFEGVLGGLGRSGGWMSNGVCMIFFSYSVFFLRNVSLRKAPPSQNG